MVRGDPVPLHEQIRSQRRASFAGVVLGMLGLCGVAVFALIVPSPDWRNQTVIVGASSGSMYVVAHGPDRLVPVANLPAARLVLAALRRGGASGGDPATAKPVSVPDATLDGAARTPTAAVPGAVAVRTDGTSVAPQWALCDRVDADGRLIETTVIGGATRPEPVPAGDGVLLAGSDNSTWLVTAGHRHRVDTANGRLQAAFRLQAILPRAATSGLLSALPVGADLVVPDVPGRGDPAPGALPGRVGDVLVSQLGGEPQSFVVLRGGLQEVRGVIVKLLVVASAHEERQIGIDVLDTATYVDELQVDGWPSGVPRMREPGEVPVVCWTWAADGRPSGDVWMGDRLPLPAGISPVALAQADGPGDKVDAIAVGAGGAVRATGPGRAPGAGPLWLLSASGVAYGVVDDATAAAIGITAAEPAPEAALRLFPTGPVLDLAQASRVVDVLPAG